jgi:hypothetical protein
MSFARVQLHMGPLHIFFIRHFLRLRRIGPHAPPSCGYAAVPRVDSDLLELRALTIPIVLIILTAITA